MSAGKRADALVNGMMKLLLRSPLHPMVSKFLLITFTGRRSGRRYTTPIGYSEHGDQLYAFTHARWWRNLRGGAPVTVWLRGREVAGIAEPVEEEASVAAGLRAHLQKAPGHGRFFRVSVDPLTGPFAADVERAAQDTVMIRVRLDRPAPANTKEHRS